jgi:anti-sigma factor (TIGR02949 family)
MLSCREVIEHLWDYLDGELPPERMQEIAEHLAECGRCYPQCQFEFAFLEALARSPQTMPRPSKELVERLRQLVTA